MLYFLQQQQLLFIVLSLASGMVLPLADTPRPWPMAITGPCSAVLLSACHDCCGHCGCQFVYWLLYHHQWSCPLLTHFGLPLLAAGPRFAATVLLDSSFPPLHCSHINPLSPASAHPCCWRAELGGDGVQHGCVDVAGVRHGVVVAADDDLVWYDDACWPLMIMKLLQFASCLVRVTIAIAITIVGLRWCFSFSCCCGVLVALGGKDVMVINILIENVSTLLMLLKDCWAKQTNKQIRVRL